MEVLPTCGFLIYIEVVLEDATEPTMIIYISLDLSL